MKYNKVLLLLLLLFIVPLKSFSQGEIDDEKKIFFRNEKSWAVFINNNGIGANYRKGKRINAFRKRLWEVDLHYIEHDKEILQTLVSQFSPYKYGKMNFTWEIKGGIGYQHQLFRKMDKTGVEIRYFYTGGPSFLFLKPIYYTALNGQNKDITSKFNPDSLSNITGKASFIKGFDELSVDPGFQIKGGLSFEYSKRDRRLLALELGASAGIYLFNYEIMYGHKSRFLFSLFISFRWGKIVRGGHMEGVEMEGDENY